MTKEGLGNKKRAFPPRIVGVGGGVLLLHKRCSELNSDYIRPWGLANLVT